METGGLKAAILTLGCKVNSYESARMAEKLEEAGFTMVDFSKTADVYLVNTCTVTEIAAKKSRQMLRRARGLNPDALVCAAGCYVDRGSELLSADLVDLLIPNSQKDAVAEHIEKALYSHRFAALSKKRGDARGQGVSRKEKEGRIRAYLKIQDGCRQFCSYCIIPKVRGPLSFKEEKACVEEASLLVQAGFREIVLTGIHVSSYGLKGQGPLYDKTYGRGDAVNEDLSRLMREIDQIPDLARLRLSSLEPSIMTEGFLEQIASCQKLCPHFHLSLQSGSDEILSRMRRDYTAKSYLEALSRVRRYFPGAGITTDIIVGFPGETRAHFEETLAMVREAAFSEVHVFRYSAIEGTPSASYEGQISGAEKKARSEELLSVVKEQTESFMASKQGKRSRVLLETAEPEIEALVGYTPEYVRTAVPLKSLGIRSGGEAGSPGEWIGKEIPVIIEGYERFTSTNHVSSGVEHILSARLSEE